jgi:hypothetical protein
LAESKGRVFYDQDGNAIMLAGPAAADPFDVLAAAERFDALAAFIRVSPPVACPGGAREGRAFPDARGNVVVVSGPVAAEPFCADVIAAALEDVAAALRACHRPLRGNRLLSDIHRNGDCRCAVYNYELGIAA